MNIFGRIKYFQLACLSKPPGERLLYRAARRRDIRTIVEIGVGDLHRAQNLIELSARVTGNAAEISYTGIDLYDARPAEQHPLSLKSAFQILNATGARIKLVPGDPGQSLIRTANTLLGTDLLLISSELEQSPLAWYYIPRLLHSDSAVMQQADGHSDTTYRAVTVEQIECIANAYDRRQAA
ncbi:MAG: hypothetical protein VX988_04315 [Planctomycetota bacterium]|nr:hypothetical protein [Planctomycetota bacterium]